MYCSDREYAVEIFGDINNWNIVQHFDNGSMSYFDSDREQSILEQNSDLDENLLSDLRETIDNLTDLDNDSDSIESESESDNEEERMIPGEGFNIRISIFIQCSPFWVSFIQNYSLHMEIEPG